MTATVRYIVQDVDAAIGFYDVPSGNVVELLERDNGDAGR